MVSYYRSTVTLCLKCTVLEIWRHIGRKSPKKPNPPSFGTFLWGDSLRIFRRIIPRQKLEWWGYRTVYISRSCFRSARHNTGVWQTDGQTDRRTRRCRKDPRVKMKRTAAASRGFLATARLSCSYLFLISSQCHRQQNVNVIVFLQVVYNIHLSRPTG